MTRRSPPAGAPGDQAQGSPRGRRPQPAPTQPPPVSRTPFGATTFFKNTRKTKVSVFFWLISSETSRFGVFGVFSGFFSCFSVVFSGFSVVFQWFTMVKLVKAVKLGKTVKSVKPAKTLKPTFNTTKTGKKSQQIINQSMNQQNNQQTAQQTTTQFNPQSAQFIPQNNQFNPQNTQFNPNSCQFTPQNQQFNQKPFFNTNIRKSSSSQDGSESGVLSQQRAQQAQFLGALQSVVDNIIQSDPDDTNTCMTRSTTRKQSDIDASLDPNNPMNDWSNKVGSEVTNDSFNPKDALASIFGAGSGSSIWESTKNSGGAQTATGLGNSGMVSNLWGDNEVGQNKSGLASIW